MDNNKWKSQSQLTSFKCALKGISEAFKRERHLQFHLILSCVVLVFAMLVGLKPTEWLLIIIAIVMVVGAELLNSAVEAMVDMISQDFHPEAKYIKDVCAGLVLFASIGAVIIGGVIFIPKLLRLL